MAARLKFHSWIRGGLSQGVTTPADQFGNPAATSQGVAVGLKIGGISEAINTTVTLRGPGDVAGLNSAQIIRVEPNPNTRDFEPNYFPFVELVSPELPWLFTNARATAGGRLRPWLALVVLEQSQDLEVKPASAGGNAVVAIKSQAGRLLPALKDAYAWCHVQESLAYNAASAAIKDRLENTPEAFLARIVCPIQLKKTTAYTAFLVPSFEAGRRAGLGIEPNDSGNADAWSDSSESLELPIYYSWSFSTGTADFETLVRRLKPFPVDETVGLHDLDIGHPRGGLDLKDLGGSLASLEELLLSFAGVLRSPAAAPRIWPAKHKPVFQKKLEQLLTPKAKSAAATKSYRAHDHDPVVNPPLYGHWQAQVPPAPGREDFPAWMDRLNMDPVNRAVAGVATQVVRRHQETFMAEAWEHTRNVRRVQRELRQARLALMVGRRIHARLKTLRQEDWLQLTSPTHKRIQTADNTQTVFASVNRSKFVPSGVTDSGFRRFSQRQQRKLRQSANSETAPSLNLTQSATRACVVGAASVKRLAVERVSKFTSLQTSYQLEKQPLQNDQKTVKRPAPTTKILSGSDSAAQLKQESGELTLVKPIGLPEESRQAEETGQDINLKSIAADSRTKTNPATTVPELTFQRVSGLTPPPASAAPIPKFARVDLEFKEPAYRKLQALSPEFFLPGFGRIPNNTVSVLEANPEFIESYLVGLSHEMSREFAWREYPALLTRTWFKRFWDYVDEPDTRDISPIAAWPKRSKLGSHTFGFSPDDKAGRTVLLIKGDLLRRYPNTIVYAARARWVKKETIRSVKWERFDRLTGDSTRLWARQANLTQPRNIRLPIFMGTIGEDAHFLGFDLDVREIYGSAKRGDNKPGWFFVFEEHMTEPRFGLDLADSFSPKTAPGKIADLSWGHFGADQNELDALRHLPLTTPWSKRSIEGIKWGQNSAEMARLTYQLPVRLMFHADSLIDLS